VREFLSGHEIPFVDRNIRQSVAAREELEELGEGLVVPQLFWGDTHIVGFDPEALDELVRSYRAASS
jgi:glutaredoxin